MAQEKGKSEPRFQNLRDFSSVLKNLDLNDGNEFGSLVRNNFSGSQFTPSPTKSTRSSLGLLPPGALENISIVDSVDGSIHFPKMSPNDIDGNTENIPPKFFKPRFEIESGILDEDGEADLENFLDDKDIKQLDDLYTPATTSDSDSDVMSISGKETVVNLEGKASKGAKHPGPVGAGLGLMRSGAMMGAVKENLGVNYGSSSDELAVPLERTYNSPLDKDGFARPLPPGDCITPRAALRPRPCINTSTQGIPASLFLPNDSHSVTKQEIEHTPSLPPRAPVGWGSFLDKSSNFPASNQQSFNCSGFPWEQLVPKDVGNTSVPGTDQEKVSSGQNQSLGASSMNMSKAAETSVALDTSCMGPLDPSFYSGKISARSTSLGPSGEIEDRTMDDNFSDFSKPASFRSSYSSNYTTQDESIVHSGFPPIMSVSGQPFSASLQPKNPFDSPSLTQSGSSVSGGFDNPFQTSKSSAVYNPFDMGKHNMSSQPVDEEFCEMDASYNMENFLAAEEAECLQKHNFIQEEDMDKDSGDTSMMSGVSDKSIVLRNNGLWAGNTSQVNLDKLREETRLSRDEYFRLKSSRLGCLEGSMTEVDRPDFGFLHKIRSPEHKPSPLLDESCSDSSNRNTYNVVTPTMDTPEISKGGGASGEMDENEYELPPQYFNISGSSNNSALRKPSLTDGQGTAPSSAESSYLHSGDSTKTLTSMNSSDLQFKDLAQRLEALTEDSDGPNVSYPDVVEASINQSREFEKSLSSFVDGEINLSTISRALSDANVSLDPQQFVNLIKNTFTAQKRSQVEPNTGSKDDDKTPVPSPFVETSTKAHNTAGQTTKNDAITTTPKTSAANDSLNYKARRNIDIAEKKPQSPTDMITDSIRKNIKPLSSGSKQPSSISAPVTPRDTPVPPLSKSTSVPYSIESSGRRRNPSGSKHSSPKKSPKKVVIRTDTPQGLEHLLESGDHTPSMCVTHRKHLQTSTPYHPNLNLSSVIMDNLVTGDKSISPFVNPDLSINAANLDVSLVSPDLYSSIQKGVGGLPPVKHMTPTTASGYTEVQVGSDSLHHSSVLHISDSFNIDQVFSSHCWQVLKIPVVHAAMQEFKAVMKITSIWIGSVEIPPEYWNQILSMSSTESVINIIPSTDVIELRVFARREGAFAINIGLISPGGHTSSCIVRFQIEEPILRLLTRNGHTVDFGTVVHKASSNAQVMLVNGGSSNLNLSLEIVSDSDLFSFSEDKAEKTTQFVIPGCAKTSVQGEGIMKELKVWAITNTINKKHVEPCVYSGQLEIKLGAKDSKVVLGKVQIILRVCFSSLVMKPSNMLEFTCGEGKKCSQKLEITCEGNQPLDVEASIEHSAKGTFIFDKKFKVFPGVSKFLAIEFVSRPGCTGNDSQSLNLKMMSGGITYKVEMRTKVLSKQQESIFASTASPGLKLGLLAAEESIDRFPVDADKNLMNWFAVVVGEQEVQQISLRNYYNFPVTLNVMIRDTDEFYLKEATESETNTKICFKPHETKTCAVVYRPKTTRPVKGKLVLKPANIKIGGKIFKASITLQGLPGAANIKLNDLKSLDDAKFFLDIDQEPPVSRQFKIENSGTATGFVKIVCLETMSHSDDSSVTISPSEFLLKSGDSKTVYLTFGPEYTSLEANLAIFCGTELVRHVYTRARKLPGSVRLSGSRALLGLDFTKPIGDGDDQENISFTGDITSEDASHFYNKSQKLQVKVSLREKQADFHALGVEETMSESRLETTAMAAIGNVKNKWDQLTASPPTPDCSTIARILHILPQNLSLTAGGESIVKIINKSSDTLHWDLNWPAEFLDCSPPAGQLAKGGQAIILVSAKADTAVVAQGWRGRVEVFSEQTVDYINVVIKPKTANIKCLLEASPSVLDFGLVSQGLNDKKVLSLTNKSQAMVQWKAFANGSDIFELSQYAGILNPSQTVNLAVAFKPAQAGPVSAVVDIISQIVKGALKEGGEVQYLSTSVEIKGVSVVQKQYAAQNNAIQNKSEVATEAGNVNPKLKEPTTVSVPVNEGPKQVDETRQQRQAKAVLSLDSDSIAFGSVPVGRSQISKVTVKNKTGQSQMIHLSLEPGSPFIIIHDKVEMKSQSFSKIPVYFRPTCSGRFGAHLNISSDSGWSTMATLFGTGVIAEETATHNVS